MSCCSPRNLNRASTLCPLKILLDFAAGRWHATRRSSNGLRMLGVMARMGPWVSTYVVSGPESLVRQRVLFDARPGGTPTGIGRFARTLAGILREGVTGHDCWTLGGEAGDLSLAATSPIEEEFELPLLLEREGIDVFHSPLFHLPATLPCRSIVTIHDAVPAIRPDLTNESFARLFERAEEAATRADLVICPSGSAKADVVRALRIPVGKVHVVPEAPAACFGPLRDEARAAFRKRRARDGAFILVVGSLERRKNPGLVLDALAKVPAEEIAFAVFAGPDAGFDLAAEACRRGLEGRVRGLGHVSDEDLVALYNEAAALVFPSLYEGFGLPVVDAFPCGTPVIASNAASIPEVAGDAALLIDPEDAATLAQAIRRLVATPDLAADLCRRGKARFERFTPDVVRGKLAALYTELAAVAV